jgi:oligopeptide/dipeptide ABC transporter ATP-binding protein
MSAAQPLLSVHDLRVTFPAGEHGTITAVDSVSLEIGECETLGLVGESGCGKTTLGRAVLQLIRPSGGTVSFLGQELSALSGSALRSMRRHIQVVFQDPRGSLDPRMRVQQIVEEPLKVHKLGSGAERSRMVREMLQQVGLDASHERRRPSELSGGQQQRVGIARALIVRPRLVVCDEPVSSLDVSIQAQVLNLLQDLKARFGVAYLFIAHNLAVVRHISDRIAVMYLGQVVEQAPAEQLFQRPLHPYTQALIASVLQPDLGARAHLASTQQLVSGDVPTLLAPPPGCRYHPRCPFAQDRCREERPALERADDGHVVACHFWRDIEPNLTPNPSPTRRGENTSPVLPLSAPERGLGGEVPMERP